MKKFIDPPSGWRYGFPKEIPENVTDTKKWLIENGYPKSEIDNYGEYFNCRYFMSGDVNVSDNFQIGPDGAYEHEENSEFPDDEIKQTAVEWLIEKMLDSGIGICKEWREKAKDLEKNQMKEAILSQVTSHTKFRKVFEQQFEHWFTETYVNK